MTLKKISVIVIIALIMLSVMSPMTFADENKKVSVDNEQAKTNKLEVKEAVKLDKKTSYDNTASGDSKVKSSELKLKTTKTDKGLKISAIDETKSQKEQEHILLIPVADIPNFNGQNVRVMHFNDAGVKDDEFVQKVESVVVDGVECVPVQTYMSEVIVDGFTGYYQATYSDINLTDTDISIQNVSGSTVTIDVSGVLPESNQIDENNTADYPDGAVAIYNFNGNSNDLLGNYNGTDSGNVSYNDSCVYFDDDGYVTIPNIILNDMFSIVATDVVISQPISYIYGQPDLSANRLVLQSVGGNLGVQLSNGTDYETVISSSYVADGQPHDISVSVDNTNILFSIDGGFEDKISTMIHKTTTLSDSRLGGFYSGAYTGSMGGLSVYQNVALNMSEIRQLSTGSTGLSVSTDSGQTWTPINSNTITIDTDNVSSLRFLSTEDVTVDSITLTQYFTDDVTIIEESEDEDHVYVYANITQSQNATSGSWEYDVSSANFTYNLSMTSTNLNATAEYHNGTISVETGQTFAGVEYLYNFTLSKLTEFNYTVNWISKSSTKAVLEYNSSNPGVENDFYLEDMEEDTTFDFKYSNGTVLMNSTSDSSGYLQFDDVGGYGSEYQLVNDTYTIETQAEKFPVPTFVAVGGGFAAVIFAIGSWINQRRKRF
jgi:hypothetical protein